MAETTGRVAATLAGIRTIEQAATPGEWKHRTAQARGDWTSRSKVMPIERVEADARPHGIGIFDASADAEFIATARTAIPRLLAAVDRVLELHSRWEIRDGDDGEGEFERAVCRHCCASDGGGQTEDCAVTHMADECWPCPTHRAITAALTGTPGNDSPPAAAVREDEEP